MCIPPLMPSQVDWSWIFRAELHREREKTRLVGGEDWIRTVEFHRNLRPPSPRAFCRSDVEFPTLLMRLSWATGGGKSSDFLEFTDADWVDGFALMFFGACGWCERLGRTWCAGAGGAQHYRNRGAHAGSGVYDWRSGEWGWPAFTKALADIGIRDGVQVNAMISNR